MATPYVSGLAALVLAQNGGFTYAQLKTRILNGVDVLPALTGKVLMAGRVNAANSLDPPAAPDAPSGLSVFTVSDSEILMVWTDNAADEAGFKIERKPAGGAYTHGLTVASDVEAHTDESLIDGTRYSYRLYAFNAGGDSGASNEDTATTPLTGPSGLSATAVSANRLDLSWSDNSVSESGYKIERKGGGSNTYSQVAVVGANVVEMADTGLNASSTYHYRVRAYNGTGDSTYSSESSATTLAVPSGGGGGGGGCFVSGLGMW